MPTLVGAGEIESGRNEALFKVQGIKLSVSKSFIEN